MISAQKIEKICRTGNGYSIYPKAVNLALELYTLMSLHVPYRVTHLCSDAFYQCLKGIMDPFLSLCMNSIEEAPSYISSPYLTRGLNAVPCYV